MTSSENGYALDWNGHASNFTINLKDLLQRKELVDVTLVAADGHMFSVHRLVLSALSPYFRQMFAQMLPVNQQAFVFLKDVPKETLEDMITFIYSGQVNVKQEHLEEFFKSAKALHIDGLVDVECGKSPASNSFTPKYEGVQYQSTRTVLVPDQAKPNHYEPHHYETQINEGQDNIEYENCEVLNEDGDDNNGSSYYEDYNYYGSETDNGNSVVMDQEYLIRDDQWNVNSMYRIEEKPAERNIFRPTNRVQCNIGYNIIADIRKNGNGSENLFYDNNKFNKHNKCNKYGQQRWECSKRKNKRCKAAASTMEVNGAMMMKVVSNEHLH